MKSEKYSQQNKSGLLKPLGHVKHDRMLSSSNHRAFELYRLHKAHEV